MRECEGEWGVYCFRLFLISYTHTQTIRILREWASDRGGTSKREIEVSIYIFVYVNVYSLCEEVRYIGLAL